MDVRQAFGIVAQTASLAPLPKAAHIQTDQALAVIARELGIDLTANNALFAGSGDLVVVRDVR